MKGIAGGGGGGSEKSSAGMGGLVKIPLDCTVGERFQYLQQKQLYH